MIVVINAYIYYMSCNASTDELYFVTLTVVDRIDVITRRSYNNLYNNNRKPYLLLAA